MSKSSEVLMSDYLFLRQASVIGGSSFDCSEQWPFAFPLHKHDLYSELLLISEGSGKFSIDGTTYEAGPGTILLYHRGIWHEEMSVTHPFRARYLAFRGLQIQGLPPDYFLASKQTPIIRTLGNEEFSVLYHLVGDIANELKQKKFEYQNMTDHMFGIFLTRLGRHVYSTRNDGKSKKRPKEAVYFARRYMEEHYDQKITLTKLAALSFVNPYHLAHLFKDETGISPIQFLIQYRVEVAKRYLLTTDLSIQDIAEAIGYSSETSFQHLFRKLTGVTPGQFRLTGHVEIRDNLPNSNDH
ncbi:AraC family transcriptional regulator [Bacillus sp. FJAT-28004]|uniref:AraC family transcriptional regulator n=1 Tax=Bacillus sp. FJAT-28004 TaxID=1679165 RepID=UPI0013793871|nr:AraC family transcriptional regulator [Bacillus sp. FJAT-28004]